ncbi:MAG: 23S rRNA (guanosine(2251)-2'-O)-methyltransferase RlmB [Candidatus Desulfofervidaceae bacterium]|nr:23S rRNA (guanosine(2251)-2'-O)-methyltransferase RlmB [Candidatus Desulfofervidaceae bacterium]
MNDYIYGFHPVIEALTTQPDIIEKLFLAEDIQFHKKQKILALARQRNILVKFRPRIYLDNIFKKTGQVPAHQGVAGKLRTFHYIGLETLLNQPAKLILLLDHIQDPQNLGNIIRSAAAFGVNAVILPKDRAAGITSTVIKASAGAALRLPIIRVTNLAQTIDELKKAGFWCVGTVVENGMPLWEIPKDLPLVLVIGHEHQGLSRLVKEKCDFLATIPMQGKFNSLNAAAATAICLYELLRPK